MATLKVQGVSMYPQDKSGVCWYACAKMLYKYSKANGGTMSDPEENSMTQARYSQNGTWPSDNATLLATTLNMGCYNDFSMDYDMMWHYFSTHGPLWTSVQKNWQGGKGYGHVVVLAGCRNGANGGIYVMDPEPMKKGSSFWLTWKQINKALKGQEYGYDWQYLTAKAS